MFISFKTEYLLYVGFSDKELASCENPWNLAKFQGFRETILVISKPVLPSLFNQPLIIS